MEKTSLLKRLINSFSFSTKFLIVLILMLLCVWPYFFQILLTKYPNLQRHTTRLEGIDYQKTLNLILVNMVHFRFDVLSSNNELQHRQVIRSIDDLFNELESRKRARWLTRKHAKGIDFLGREWQIVRTFEGSRLTNELNQMIRKTFKIINIINEESSLEMNEDGGTSHYITVTTEIIPNILVLLNRLGELIIDDKASAPKRKAKISYINTELNRLLYSLGQNYQAFDKVNPTPGTSKENDFILDQISKWQAILVALSISDSRVENNDSEVINSIEAAIISTNNLTVLLFQQLQEILVRQHKSARFYLYFPLILTLFGTVVMFGMYLTRTMAHPLFALSSGIKALKEGNLKFRIPIRTQDEIGEISVLFNQIADLLENNFISTKHVAKVISEKSAKIHSMATELQGRVNEQTISIDGVVGSARTIQQGVTYIETSLTKASDITEGTIEHANLAEERLAVMMKSFFQTQKSATDALKTLIAFRENIGVTKEIINSIVQVVDQANLLSMNSAIKSRLVGEKGVGFVVISKKINDLANQSAFITLDIEKKIMNTIPVLENVSEKVNQFSIEVKKQATDMNEIKNKMRGYIDLTRKQIKVFSELKTEVTAQTEKSDLINSLADAHYQLTSRISKSAKLMQSEVKHLFEAAASVHKIVRKFQGDR